MSGTSLSLLSTEALTRANQLDSIAAVLPPERRDTLASLLTQDDIATLKHLVDKGLGANTLRAMASDLAYIDAWARVATGEALPWPAPQPLLLKFIAHHLWDPIQKAEDPHHGMPEEVRHFLISQKLLRGAGPHAPATVRRRIALWSTLHRWRGLVGPFSDPHVRTALQSAVRATFRPPKKKSQKALTKDILDKLLATCWRGDLTDMRDRALLLFAFASGGRRRSEVARLNVAQLHDEPPTPENADDPSSLKLPCISIALGRTKNENGDNQSRVYIVGRSVVAMKDWLQKSGITQGAIFRAIGRWNRLSSRALTPEAVNGIIKRRCKLAGLNPIEYSAHGLRSGYMTEAARQRVPILEAMQQSRHKTVEQASVYYNEADRSRTHAARLGG
ncbi:tyrosine-type recombinase/integrase [Rhodomicrobium vannielii ATCC 17100]|uniref:tyrosine-type recombinase/integrase n=1 Tax=Rhodomicrobium vannielii TaxID=1069 RepID=UPI0019182DE5|nr:tyrosine-type recombinase/integrase [Rhodomicrobium vannielii]MBJ7532970.1 tyrosine-type recombinase/integrase [Rhodomicrobium vannielii ATCC 17100]